MVHGPIYVRFMGFYVNGFLSLYQLGKPLYRNFGEVVKKKESLQISDLQRLASLTGGNTHYDGLYGEAPPERGTFFRLQVYKRVGISLVEVYGREGKLSFGSVKGPKGLKDEFYGFK